MGKSKRITDIITKQDVLNWKKNSNVLLSAPMGAGKSYFCKNVLYDIAKSMNGKILMLIHRSNCVEQFKYEIETDGKADVIEVVTYQSLEYGKLHNKDKHYLTDYMFVVCDEFHYFYNDSSFNNKTAISYNMIMGNTTAIHVFMSATGDHMIRYMKKYIKEHNLEDAVEYQIPLDFSFIKQLTFFHKDLTMEEFLKEGIESGDKGIFFIQSAEKAYKLYSKHKKNCIFNCSANNKKYYEFVDKEKVKNILQNQRFEEQFLITTSCFDAGINIIDTDVKHIVIDIVDIGSLIQCMGRKRIQNENDKVNIYIKILNNQKLAGLKRSMETKVEMADFYMKNGYSVDKLIDHYPMQNDVNNILYDDLTYDAEGSIIPNSYTKKINEPMYFKKKEDIADYSIMLKKFDKFGYCKYLASVFGFFDKGTGLYTYRIINEDNGLESYLERLVKENKVMLYLKDRQELIKKINAKQDGKLLRNKDTLNTVLKEREIDYRIINFQTNRLVVNQSGNKIYKKFKAAWKIEKCNSCDESPNDDSG